MKYLLLFFSSLIFISIPSSGQDSVIKFRSYSSELKNNAQKTLEGKYFKYMPTRMQEGDRVTLTYSSDEFIPELVIQDSLGDAVKKNQGQKPYGSTTSKITLTFTAPYSMLYYFMLSTKEPGKTGKYNIKMYYYNKRADKITDSNSFCEKLNYIIESSHLNFEFIKKDHSSPKTFEPTVHLINGNECSISDTNTVVYTCKCIKTSNKADADKVYAEWLSSLNDCLKTYDKQPGGTTSEPAMEYKQEGNEENDLDAAHTLMNVKGDVELKYTRSGDNYSVYLTIK